MITKEQAHATVYGLMRKEGMILIWQAEGQVDGDGRPFFDRSRPVYRQQYQLEPVCHLTDAVFDGYTCHALVPTSNLAVLTTKVRTTPPP